MFFNDVLKIVLNIWYRTWSINSSFHVRAHILNLLFLYDFFIFFHVYQMLRFENAIYLSLLFKSFLSERLSNSLWRSDVLLFPEFINIISILFHNSIEFVILLYTFLVISFPPYREYMICLVSSEFSDVLPAFDCLPIIFEAIV